MPRLRAFFCPFPPMSDPKLRAGMAGTFKTEDTVEKHSFLSETYADRASTRDGLDRRYGEIGISAVAAAVRYQGDSKAAADARDDDQVSAWSAT
jgi:hypothetical protein